MKEQKTTWITFKDDDGCIKSVPLQIFENLRKKKAGKK